METKKENLCLRAEKENALMRFYGVVGKYVETFEIALLLMVFALFVLVPLFFEEVHYESGMMAKIFFATAAIITVVWLLGVVPCSFISISKRGLTSMMVFLLSNALCSGWICNGIIWLFRHGWTFYAYSNLLWVGLCFLFAFKLFKKLVDKYCSEESCEN